MVVTKVERIDLMKVRQYCIHKNLYTCGTVEQYNEMFDMCTAYNEMEGDDNTLEEIARDIIHHSSNVELANFCEEGDVLVMLVMFGLYNDCVTVSFRKEA